MKRLLFIYNPTAGKGRIAAELSQILTIFSKAGWLTTVCPTQGKGDAIQLAAKLGGEYDRVICSGGDGTLSETVAGMIQLERPPVLGYIPAGSTNDCATTLHLPRSLPKAALVAAKTGKLQPWDVGMLGTRSFVYVAAFGAFTSVSYETPQDLKNTFGHLAYIMGGVASIPSIAPYPLRLEYDGNVIEDEFYYGMVCNTVSVGGMKALPADKVELDDGLFEVVLVRKPTSIADVSASLQALIRRQIPPEESALLTFHASKLTFASDTPLPWTVDGEFGGRHQTAVIENRKQALTFIQGEEEL